MFGPLPRTDRLELLDDPARVSADLAPNLADIRRLNRWFGGTALALACVRPLLRRREHVTLLDVATGTADVPLAIVRWAAVQGITVEAVGLDVSPEVLAEARSVVPAGAVKLIEGTALALPFPAASFDVVMCNLALHHFTPRDAMQVLQEMRRVARHAAVVTDLRRSYAGYGSAWLATRTVARNRLTRHDGPLSVLRAYSPAELRRLAMDAGWERARFRHSLIRQSAVLEVGSHV